MTAFAFWISSDPPAPMSVRWARGAALAIALFAQAVHGSEDSDDPFELPENVQVHGFASQAYIKTSANNFFGSTSGGGSWDFRELGINGSWRALSDLQLSLQLVARWAGETDDGDPRVDYGFMDYSIVSDADNLWGIRGGRILNPFGFYNETRDVAFTRPSILLPQSIYFDRNRNLALSADGLQVYGERRTNVGNFFIEVTGGFPRVQDPDLVQSITRGIGTGELDPAASMLGRLQYERDGGATRLALTGGMINVNYDRGPNDPVPSGSLHLNPVILSAQYNAEKWSLTSEYGLRHLRFEDFGVFQPDPSFTGESYYFQGTYRFSPRWEGMARYDVFFRDRDDRNGAKFESAFGVPGFTQFAKDWTVGLRWDVTQSIMFRAEFHRVSGTAWLSPLENPNPNDLEQHWNLFSVLGSFRF